MATKWQGEPKRWRVRARSPSDGMIVTIGRYDTEAEAKADRERYIETGYYRDVRVEPIPPPKNPPAPKTP